MTQDEQFMKEAIRLSRQAVEHGNEPFGAVLVKDGYDPAYGARPVKRAIQRDLENPIAKLIVSGKFLPGATIKVTAKEGRIVI